MLLRRASIQNVRSFLDRTEFVCDGSISIVIGPNGGGKTNLLDTIVTMLRRYLFASMYAVHSPTPDNPNRHQFQANDFLNNMVLERHSDGADLQQIVEVELEVTSRDCENMVRMRDDAKRLAELASGKYINVNISQAALWTLADIQPGARLEYSLIDGTLTNQAPGSAEFLQYLNFFEIDSRLREEFDFSSLNTPMIYLPVNRTASSIDTKVQLAGYNAYEQKRQNDAALSRGNAALAQQAIGRLAQVYRVLLERDSGSTRDDFHSDPNLRELSRLLKTLGYEWELVCSDPLRNEYDINLKKQGSSFRVSAASSGERELLTYLFSIFALNVRDALILVDEPELHLHPKWQSTLLSMFGDLSRTTGNQFILATHSPTFIGPDSIKYVSRVFSRSQRSNIVSLEANTLPESRHLFNMVNSHNNERLFFADFVVLVEGLSDRLFFEAALARQQRLFPTQLIIEVVSVGGKGFFDPYRRLLNAFSVGHVVVADLDYLEQVGDSKVKGLFRTDAKKIKKDVVEDPQSLDGNALVARIDEAMTNGSWDDARAVWDYIKGRHRQIRRNLTASQQKDLENALRRLRTKGIVILRKGALEDYLPSGYRSKEMGKLIDFLSDGSFWRKLSLGARREIGGISRSITRRSSR